MLRAYLTLPRAIYLLAVGMLINRAGTMVIIFLSRYLMQELAFSERAASASLGVFGAGSLCAAVLGGILADHIGRKPVMLLALFGGAATLVCIPYLRWMVSIYAAIFVFALTAEMYRPAAQAMISDIVEPIDRPKAFGLIFICINLGFSVAPIVGGLLAKHSYQYLFVVDAVTTTMFACVILFGISDSRPREPRDTNDRDRNDSATEGPAALSAQSVGNWETLRFVLRDRAFLIYYVAIFLSMLVYLQHLSTLSLFFGRNGIDDEMYGYLIAINGVMIVTLQVPVTLLVGRMRRYQAMILGAYLLGSGYLVNLIGVSIPLAALGVAVWTLGEMIHAPLTMTIVGDLAPPAMRGRYMGIMGTSFAAAMTLGAPAGGVLLDSFGASAVWIACMGSCLLASCCFWIIRNAMRDPLRVAGAPASSASEGKPA